MGSKVNEFLGEKAGQSLRADVYLEEDRSYTIRYFINGDYIKEENIKGHSVYYVESACNNWIDGVKTLNG